MTPNELAAELVDTPRVPIEAVEREWSWEGCVAEKVRAHLEGQGWRTRVADTASKERGDDILARRGRRTLHVEVKGLPTKGRYADPRRAGEFKPTSPTTQATHWFGEAVLHVMRDLGRHQGHEVAIALPHSATYERLLAETETALCRLGIGVFVVRDDGSVEERLPHGRR